MEERNRKHAWQENPNSSAPQGSNYMQTGAYASGTNEKGGALRRQENVQTESNINPSSVDDAFTLRKVSALLNALEELKPHVDDIRDCLREREQTNPRERHAQREEILKAEKQNDNLIKELSDLQEKYEKQLAINKQGLQEIENIKMEQRKIIAENEQRNEQRYNKLCQKYDNEVGKIKSLTEKNDKLQGVNNTLKDENAYLKNECSQTKTKFSKLQDEHGKLKTELSDCKTRLSRLMGGQLSNNNPDIADLSDANRPTKLGEMYQELYDNEWTEAFEQCLVEFNQDESKGIRTLLDLLQEIKSFCDRKAEEQTTKLKEAVAMAYDGARTTETPENISRQIKDLRKQVAEISVEKVYQDFNVYCKNGLIMGQKVQPFVKRCTKLCWLMTVQTPPVVFGPVPRYGELFDTNLYKHYTSTGTHIEFCVWPTMLLHKDGPLLSKGVAQGRKPQCSQSVFYLKCDLRNDTASALSASLRNVSKGTQELKTPFNERPSVISTPNSHESRQQIQRTTQNAAPLYQLAAEQPTEQEWDTFQKLEKLYGLNSYELKERMKDRTLKRSMHFDTSELKKPFFTVKT